MMNTDAETYITPLANIELAKCRTCGRDIIWTISPAGARLPVDARPAGPHVYAIVIDAEVGPRAVKITPVIDCDWRVEDAKEPDKVFVSHWLTCPRPPKTNGARLSVGGGPAPRARGRRPEVVGGNAKARQAKGHDRR